MGDMSTMGKMGLGAMCKMSTMGMIGLGAMGKMSMMGMLGLGAMGAGQLATAGTVVTLGIAPNPMCRHLLCRDIS